MPLSEGGSGLGPAAAHAIVTSLDPVFLCSLPGGEILLASHSAGQLLGVPAEELTGKFLARCLNLSHDIAWHDGEPSTQRLWLLQDSGGMVPLTLHATRVPDSEGALGIAWVRPVVSGLLVDLARILSLPLRIHDPAGRPVFDNPAALPLPAGPLPSGDTRADARTWQVVRIDLDEVIVNIATEVTTWEARARESEERAASFRLMLDSIEDFVGVVSITGQRLFINPAFFRATGWTEEEINTTDFRSRIHPDDLNLVERAHEANLRGERTRIEYRCRRKDGSYLWLDLRATPLPGPDGGVVRIIWASRDITERKRLEHELRDSRRFIEQVADAIPQMLFVYDLVANKFIWVNAQCRTVRGYTPGEMLSMPAGEAVRQVHPEDRLGIEAVMGRLLDAGEGAVVQMSYRVQHPERGWRRLNTRCLVFRYGADGRPWQVLGVSEDVTDTPS